MRKIVLISCKKVFSYSGKLLTIFLLLSISLVTLFKWVNPPFTSYILLNKFDAVSKKKHIKISQSWVPIEHISIDLIHSFLAAEDTMFFQHKGFDWDLMWEAWNFYKNDKHNIRVYGGSTISQQTAKNIFLSPSRNIARKIFELYFTLLLEGIWGKKRILEVYLNIIELGEGVYGVEAACQKYYQKSSAKTPLKQAILLAATTTDPKETSVLSPSDYLLKRSELIRWNIRHSRSIKQAIYLHIFNELEKKEGNY